MAEENLERYLTEPTELVGEIASLKEKLAEYQQVITTVESLEKNTSDVIKLTKDPKSHNAQGLINLYGIWKGLSEAVEEGKLGIGKGYTIKIGNKKLKITPENTTKVWDYRLNWLSNTGIKALFMLYKDDVQKLMEDTRKTFDELIEKYKN